MARFTNFNQILSQTSGTDDDDDDDDDETQEYIKEENFDEDDESKKQTPKPVMNDTSSNQGIKI